MGYSYYIDEDNDEIVQILWMKSFSKKIPYMEPLWRRIPIPQDLVKRVRTFPNQEIIEQIIESYDL